MLVTVIPTKMPDVLIIKPKVFSDDRGWFFESFNEKEFSSAVGKQVKFVQDNHSFSKKGVLRGLHYQTKQMHGKLVRVIRGSVYDVTVDLRNSSLTFGKWMGIELSANNKKQLWIPGGFAHGFLALSDEVELSYKTTDYWHPSSEQSIAWNDPTLNIQWPNIGIDPILSFKDQQGLSWSQAPKFN